MRHRGCDILKRTGVRLTGGALPLGRGRMTPARGPGYGRGELLTGETPICEPIEPGLQESLSVVLMIKIVGVFPKIADENWGQFSVRQERLCIVGRKDLESAVMVRREPHPT